MRALSPETACVEDTPGCFSCSCSYTCFPKFSLVSVVYAPATLCFSTPGAAAGRIVFVFLDYEPQAQGKKEQQIIQAPGCFFEASEFQ